VKGQPRCKPTTSSVANARTICFCARESRSLRAWPLRSGRIEPSFLRCTPEWLGHTGARAADAILGDNCAPPEMAIPLCRPVHSQQWLWLLARLTAWRAEAIFAAIRAVHSLSRRSFMTTFDRETTGNRWTVGAFGSGCAGGFGFGGLHIRRRRKTSAPAAVDTRAADEVAIRAVDAAWTQGGGAKDNCGHHCVYADNAVLMARGSHHRNWYGRYHERVLLP
jgi:hypothetical protein